MSVRPGSFDEVLLAYERAQRDRRDLQDRLRIAVGATARLEAEIVEKDKTVAELRGEVERYKKDAA